RALSVEEAVIVGGVDVILDVLARIVDAECEGAEEILFQRIVERGVSAAAFEKAVCLSVAIVIVPDDLARVVDARCNGAHEARQGIVGGGVSAAASEEAVVGASNLISDDVPGVVDAARMGARGGQAEGEAGWGGVDS